MRSANEVNVFYLNEPFVATSNQLRRIETWSGDDIKSAVRFDKHVLYRRIIAGEITAIYGEPKVGKTFIAIHCGLMAAIGGPFWGEDFPEEGCRVIYVAAERREQAAIRIQAACLAYGLESIPANFTLVEGTRGLRLNDVEAMAELRELVRQINPEVIIFDTYVRMVDNDEDKAADTDRNIEILTNFLRESAMPCAGILVHHSGKDISRKMRGSSAMLAAVSTVWKVARVKASGVITLSMDDANAFAAPEPCHFKIDTFEILPTSGFEESRSVGVAVPVGGPLKLRERDSRILALMEKYPKKLWRLENLADALSGEGEPLSASTLNREVQNLLEKEKIERRKISRAYFYCLPSAP